MARKFREKKQDLIKLDVVSASTVFDKNKLTKNGTPTLKRDIDIYGKVEKTFSNFVTNTNLKGENSKFVEDTSNLTKKTKGEIIKYFDTNKKRHVVYLVKKK